MKTLALTALGLCLGLSAQASETAALDAEARQAAKALGSTLLTEVKDAMRQGGPLNAINTCNTKALPLTGQINQEQGLTVSRTALRIRNPENRPDPWERQVLEQFQARQEAGEPLEGMLYSEIIEEDGQRTYRMMQAIPTQKACLTCHGSDLAPEVADRLDTLYPHDRARGFEEGELRGAFSVRKAF